MHYLTKALLEDWDDEGVRGNSAIALNGKVYHGNNQDIHHYDIMAHMLTKGHATESDFEEQRARFGNFDTKTSTFGPDRDGMHGDFSRLRAMSRETFAPKDVVNISDQYYHHGMADEPVYDEKENKMAGRRLGKVAGKPRFKPVIWESLVEHRWNDRSMSAIKYKGTIYHIEDTNEDTHHSDVADSIFDHHRIFDEGEQEFQAENHMQHGYYRPEENTFGLVHSHAYDPKLGRSTYDFKPIESGTPIKALSKR